MKDFKIQTVIEHPGKGVSVIANPRETEEGTMVDLHTIRTAEGETSCQCGACHINSDGAVQATKGFVGSNRAYRAGWEATFRSSENREGIPEC